MCVCSCGCVPICVCVVVCSYDVCVYFFTCRFADSATVETPVPSLVPMEQE